MNRKDLIYRNLRELTRELKKVNDYETRLILENLLSIMVELLLLVPDEEIKT